ncbi:MAG: glycosyltransferase 87 family protein [Streptosporangiales bacterium]|nr:glycosyltransferase 87 family protein [Streptosporangiales bacterium]
MNEAAETSRTFPRTRLLIAGAVVFGAAVAGWFVFNILSGPNGATHDVDLTVYRDGGLIVRGVMPGYHPSTGTPLYGWGGYSALALKFTYPPFAAVAFAPLSLLSPPHLLVFSIIVNMLALPAALWCAFGGLSRQDQPAARYLRDPRIRLGATLLAAGITFWLQPAIRTVYLGQVNLVLMAMIMWDLCQPDTARSRWWKGFATGIAAGIKLTPLIFIPYLLITRRFREAAMAVAGFVFTVVVGFAVLPGDSAAWWLPPKMLIIADGTRTGFIGWAGNQSLRAVITRFAGSVAAGQDPWLVACVIAGVAGLAAAYLFDRAGHRVVAILVTALTGLLLSPISWDHHWVWITLGIAVAGYYALAVADNSKKRWALLSLAALMIIVYGPWPDALWEKARNLDKFSLGFLWAPPNTNPQQYTLHGDQSSFVEYHWHGLWLLTGNAYILGGTALTVTLVIVALRLRRAGKSSRIAPETSEPAHTVSS